MAIYELSQVCEAKKGGNEKKDKCTYTTDGKYPSISAGIKYKGKINCFNRDGLFTCISSSGANAGHVTIMRNKFYAADCFTIKSKVSWLKQEFLNYFFLKNIKEIKNLRLGAAQPHVYWKDVNKIRIFIPKLIYQKQIIDIIKLNENLFLNYPNCVRIDSLKKTKNDMQKLIDIIEPIEKSEKIMENLNQLIINTEKLLFFQINTHQKQKNTRNFFIQLISEKIDSKKLELVSVGYDGFNTKRGKLPKLAKPISQYNFSVGLISKKIPIGFNINKKVLGVSSAYYGFAFKDSEVASWYFYHYLRQNYNTFIRHSSRQGQGFEKKLFLEEQVLLPTINTFNLYRASFLQLMKLKRKIKKLNLSLLRKKTIQILFDNL